MGLLNLNKKTGDTFTAAEVNQIGAAIDQNTNDIAELRSSMMYWFVDYDEGNNTALAVGGNMEVRQNYFDMCGRIEMVMLLGLMPQTVTILKTVQLQNMMVVMDKQWHTDHLCVAK